MKKSAPQNPPKWMVAFFVWCSKPAQVDDLIGDMEELYHANIKNKTVLFARYQFFKQSIHLLLSYTVKKRKKSSIHRTGRSTQNQTSMYLNYVKIALRGLRKNISFATINILGLALGLGLCFMIILYVQSEVGYDKFHKDADRIHRITKSYKVGEKNVESARLRYYLAPPFKENIPAVEDFSSIKKIEETLNISLDERQFDENSVAFVDDNFFSFFSFKLLMGEPKSVLQEPSSIAISQSMSRKYFQGESPINQTLRLSLKSNKEKFFLAKVTGVFEDMPVNSHFNLNFLLSKSTAESQGARIGLKGLVMQHNYLKLNPGHSIEEVNDKIPYIEKNYAPSFFEAAGIHLHTQRMTDIHLQSKMEDEIGVNGDIQYVHLLSLIGVFILLIACFNYMNLATANAFSNAKEVGIRKVLGSRRAQLITRFFTESISVAVIAFLCGLVIASLSLPYFNLLSGKTLSFSVSENLNLLLVFFGIAFFVGIISGLYPALYLSKFNAVKSLKGTLSRHGKTTKVFRKSLVITQFMISAALILSTLVVFKQFEYLKAKNLGFDTERVVNINAASEELNNGYAVMKQQLLNLPTVQAVAGSGSELVTDFSLEVTNGITVPGHSQPIDMNYVFVDEDFFQLYGIPVKSGRDFRATITDAKNGIILNQTAVKRIGSQVDSIIGSKVNLYSNYNPSVIGVVEDFHFESLYQAIGPIYFQLFSSKKTEQKLKTISVKISDNSLPETISEIENIFLRLYPDEPFTLRFLDDKIQKSYSRESRFTNIFGIFSVLAIFMASLGVFGLGIQTATSRQKEISVRKVLGASFNNIVSILTKELLLLVVLANIIAAPIAYFSINEWLQNFPYRETIGFEVFVIVLISTLTITIISIVPQALKTASTNPSRSLNQND